MPWGIAAAAGISTIGSIVGGSEQSSAAQKAAQQQEQQEINAEQLGAEQYNASATMNAPTQQSGAYATQALDYLLGLTPNLNINPAFATPQISVAANGSPTLSYTGSGAVESSPGNYTVAGGSSSPMSGIASGAISGVNIGGQTMGYGSLLQTVNPQNLANTPGYQFELQQTQQALQRQIQSTGGGGSGAALEAAMNYASGLASTEYQQAYTDQQQQNQQIYNMLSGTAGAGQQATQSTVNAGTNMTNQVSSAMTGYGNAASAGTIGAANATTGEINQIAGTAGSLGSMYYLSQNNPYSYYGGAGGGGYGGYSPQTYNIGGYNING